MEPQIKVQKIERKMYESRCAVKVLLPKQKANRAT